MDINNDKQLANWSETDKALWILRNGQPNITWIFERVENVIYKRPMAAQGEKLPPWISMEREEIKSKWS
jgi:hypothetical protein